MQTGDILNTERNAARVLSRKTERAIERTKGMNTEENKVTLTTEVMSKISELASKHSTNLEDADNLRAALKDLLQLVVSYCCFGCFSGENKLLTRKTDLVRINIVSNGGDMSVTVTKDGGETKELFKCEEVPDDNLQKEIQKKVEERFLKMLDR